MNSELAKRLREAAKRERCSAKLQEDIELARLMEKAAAALSGEGFVCVPREPDEKMQWAGTKVPLGEGGYTSGPENTPVVGPELAKAVWDAMWLAAAEGGSK